MKAVPGQILPNTVAVGSSSSSALPRMMPAVMKQHRELSKAWGEAGVYREVL